MRTAGGLLILLGCLWAVSGEAQPRAKAPDPPIPLAQAILWAAADLPAVPEDMAPYTRYWWTGHLPRSKRLLAWKVLSGHANGMSREADIVQPYLVPGTDHALIRVNLRDYRWKRGVYEKLGDIDTNFHFRVEKIEVTVRNGEIIKVKAKKKRGKKKPPRYRQIREKKKVVTTVTATWLARTKEETAALAYLVERTQSQVPLLFGTFFFQRTAIQEGRSAADPGYDEFLGVKSQRDFEKLIAYVDDPRDGFREYLDAVKISGVSRKPRRVRFDEKKGGVYARTFDNDKAVDKANPLRVLNGGFVFKAVEAYGNLPNGLWAMNLFNADGTIQKTVPDFVGHDKLTRSNSGIIQKPMSCIRCHKDGGLQDVPGYLRNLINLDGRLRLQSPDYDKLKKLRQQYARHMDPIIAAGRLRYNLALAEATGMKSAEYARAYGRFWEEVDEDDVTLAQAARELGTTPGAFQRALKHYLAKTGSVDTVLASYIADDKNEQRVPRESWDEAFGLAALVMTGSVPVDFVSPEKDDVFRRRKRKK